MARVAALVRVAVSRTPLLGLIAHHRSVAFVDVNLSALAFGARRLGGTVNAALLAAVAGAAGAMLRVAGESVPEVLPASVPVALAERGASGNAVGVMVVPRPTGPSTADRVGLIAGRTASATQQARAQGTFELTRSRWASRIVGALARHQRFIALFVTNVRGRPSRCTWQARRLRWPWPAGTDPGETCVSGWLRSRTPDASGAGSTWGRPGSAAPWSEPPSKQS